MYLLIKYLIGRNCTILNNPSRPQSTENFTVTSLAFSNLTASFAVLPWLSSLNIVNCLVQPNIMVAVNNITINTNQINLYIYNGNFANNSIISVCYAFIAWDTSKTNRQRIFLEVIYYLNTAGSVHPLTSYNSTFDIPTSFTPLDGNCTFGLYFFSFPVATNVRQIYFNVRTTPISEISVTFEIASQLNHFIFCYADCSLTSFFDSTSSQCHFCSDFSASLPFCSTCNTSSICTSCISTTYYIQPPLYTCLTCSSTSFCQTCLNTTFCYTCINSSFALNVTNGCSSCSQMIQNCLQCSANNYCFQCINNYYALNQTNGCSLCNRTLANCLTCSDNNTCQICNSDLFYREPVSATCVPCSYNNMFFECQNCNLNTTQCLICKKDYFLNSSKKCQCEKGWYIANGCTTVVGCTYVVPDDQGYHCTQCDPEYSLTALRTCVCKDGYVLVSNICSNVAGCVAMVNIHGIKNCVFCHVENHFQLLLNNTCVCSNGYSLNSLNVCVSICGDGIVLDLSCDDGNIISGDGCSSKCQIQPFYVCNTTNSSSPSHCYFMGKLTLSLIKISKDSSSNAGTFVFEFSPKILSLYKINYLNYTNLSINSEYSLTSVVQSDGILTIHVEFTKNLQTLAANLTIELPSYYFIASNLTLQFSIKSNNSPLIISSNYAMIIISTQLTFYLNYVIIILFFFGSFSHKMIGVQSIQVFMFVFYFKSLGQQKTSHFEVFSHLNLVNAYNSIFYNESISLELSNAAYINQINHQFACNLFLVASATAFLAIALTTLYLVKFYHFKRSDLNEIEKSKIQKKIDVIMIRVYRNLIFPIIASWMIYQFLALYTNNLHIQNKQNSKNINKSSQNLFFSRKSNALITISSIILAFGVVLNEIRVFLLNKKDIGGYISTKKCSRTYIASYLIYIILLINAYLLQFVLSEYWAIIIIDGVIFFYTIFIIVSRPYSSNLHNFSIIFNQIVLILFVVWITCLQFQLFLPEEVQSILCVGIVGLLFFVCLICTVRIVYESCYGKDSLKELYKICKDIVDEKEQLDQNQINEFTKIRKRFKQYQQNIHHFQDDISLYNKYRIQTQMQQSLLDEMKYFNQQRYGKSLNPVYYRYFEETNNKQSALRSIKKQSFVQIDESQKNENSFKNSRIGIKEMEKQISTSEQNKLLKNLEDKQIISQKQKKQKKQQKLAVIKQKLREDLIRKKKDIFNLSKEIYYR